MRRCISGPAVSIQWGLGSLEIALHLTDALIALSGNQFLLERVNRLRVAHTLLALAACREGLAGVTRLETIRNRHEDAFRDYYRNTYFQPERMGPDVAEPEPRVARLLTGLLAARDRNTEFWLPAQTPDLPPDAAPPAPECTSPETRTADELTDMRSVFLTYDSRISPEVPSVITRGTGWPVLSFYDARQRAAAGGEVWQWGPAYPAAHMLPSIGITDASDEELLEAHCPTVATLTHWNGQTAIYRYADRDRVDRVYIPRS